MSYPDHVLFFAGCGRSSSISGSVTYNEQPIADGAITLIPADGKGATAGGRIADGKYRVDKITPGEKIVQIIGVKDVKFVASSAELEKQSQELNIKNRRTDVVFQADNVPEDAEGNNERVEIVAGHQERDFHLMPPKK